MIGPRGHAARGVLLFGLGVSGGDEKSERATSSFDLAPAIGGKIDHGERARRHVSVESCEGRLVAGRNHFVSEILETRIMSDQKNARLPARQPSRDVEKGPRGCLVNQRLVHPL